MTRKVGIYAVFVFCIQFVIAQLPVPKYATKTAYDISFNADDLLSRTLSWRALFSVRADSTKTYSSHSHNSDLQSCTPVGLYAVYRHGTRYPSTGDVNSFKSFTEKIRTSDNLNPEFKFLQHDNDMVIDLKQIRSLSKTGNVEMTELAKRLKQRFPELFPTNFHLDNYSFQSTNLSRTIDSTTAFINGLVSAEKTCTTHQTADALSVSCTSEGASSKETIAVTVQNKTTDYLLRFFDPYEDCLEEQDDAERGSKLREDEIFKMGEQGDKLHDRLVERLTAPQSTQLFNISRDEAMDLPKMCAFQRALFNRSSWCSILTPDDLRVYEYKTDLKHYWKRGYGHRVNYLVGCNLIRDVVNYMEQLTKEEINAPDAVFKFAHAETLLPLQVLLGLNKDEHPLLASNYQQNMYRKFRTSRMTPFGANVAFVIFKCSSEGNQGGDAQETYKLTVLVNELPVHLPFCQNQVCDLQDFASYIEQTVGSCGFNTTCCIENCDSCAHSVTIVLIVVAVLVGVCLLVCLSLCIIKKKDLMPVSKEKYRRYKN